MSAQLTWLGHGTWLLATIDHKILLDPFLDESPTAPVKADEIDADTILVSHGHFDHVADLVSIAKRTGATVVANFEICQCVAGQGIDNTQPMNLGGSVALPWGEVTMTLAHHSSSLPDGSYGGTASGFLLKLPASTLYFACDTALFNDMERIGGAGLDLAVLPIGDLFTMGPRDAVEAIKLLAPKRVAPAHFNTWPPIEQDAAAWAEQVRSETSAEPILLEPGESVAV